jgi:hypothetical protein
MREAMSRLALILAMTRAVCGDRPLQGMGERSGEWIDPLVRDVALLPGSDSP